MKKIIAAAVAAAFVAPAYAAEITVGGEIEFAYVVGKDAVEDKVTNNDNILTVSATEELPNGMTVTGTMNVNSDGNTLENDGTNLSLAGAFGKVTVGDTSGALDATGDWTDIASIGGGYKLDGSDQAVAWALPAIVGVKAVVSMSPEGTSTVGSGTGIKNDATAYSLTYDIGGVSVYYGSEDLTDTAGSKTTNDSMGIKGSFNGFYVAYETGTSEEGAASADVTGMAISYKLGDIVIGMEQHELTIETAGFTTAPTEADETLMYVEYNLGSNVDVYLVQKDDKMTADADTTSVGVEYNF